jgi:hypothetical protein
MNPPERIDEVRVALVGYRPYDGGPREERVDVIDARGISETLVSLSPVEATCLADQLRQVAGWARPPRLAAPGACPVAGVIDGQDQMQGTPGGTVAPASYGIESRGPDHRLS